MLVFDYSHPKSRFTLNPFILTLHLWAAAVGSSLTYIQKLITVIPSTASLSFPVSSPPHPPKVTKVSNCPPYFLPLSPSFLILSDLSRIQLRSLSFHLKTVQGFSISCKTLSGYLKMLYNVAVWLCNLLKSPLCTHLLLFGEHSWYSATSRPLELLFPLPRTLGP